MHDSRLRIVVAFFTAVAFCATWAASAGVCWEAERPSGSPLIRSIEPGEGQPGQTIRLTGEHLQGTRAVLFSVGLIGKQATFQIISETELDVIAPEFYSAGSGPEAIIVVAGADGVTVTSPVTAEMVRKQAERPGLTTSFVHVLRGGLLESASHVTVIEDGGVVGEIRGAPFAFIKSGGALGKAYSVGALFHEKGAALAADVLQKYGPLETVAPGTQRRTVGILVSAIRVSAGVGPFIYQNPRTSAALAEAIEIPEVAHIDPVQAPPGGIVTLYGRGFSGTTDVLLAGDTCVGVKAGFHVVSDNALTFQIPEIRPGHCDVLVMNARGLTLAYSLSRRLSGRAGIGSAGNPVIRVPMSGVYNKAEAGQKFLVERGGVVINSGGGCLFLVKSGGALASESVGQVFYEPEAAVPNWNKAFLRMVPEIHISSLSKGLEITWKPTNDEGQFDAVDEYDNAAVSAAASGHRIPRNQGRLGLLTPPEPVTFIRDRVYEVRARDDKNGLAEWSSISAVIVFAGMLYVLSVGPAFWLQGRGPIWRMLCRTIYFPVQYAYTHLLFAQKVLRPYIQWWKNQVRLVDALVALVSDGPHQHQPTDRWR